MGRKYSISAERTRLLKNLNPSSPNEISKSSVLDFRRECSVLKPDHEPLHRSRCINKASKTDSAAYRIEYFQRRVSRAPCQSRPSGPHSLTAHFRRAVALTRDTPRYRALRANKSTARKRYRHTVH